MLERGALSPLRLRRFLNRAVNDPPHCHTSAAPSSRAGDEVPHGGWHEYLAGERIYVLRAGSWKRGTVPGV
jgi:hypothetical protein